MTPLTDQVFRTLDIRGIDVRLVNGQIAAKWMHGLPLPTDMPRFIRHFRSLIVTELLERERLAETVANVLALSEIEYQQWRIEVESAPADDEYTAHDRVALRLAREARRLALIDKEIAAA